MFYTVPAAVIIFSLFGIFYIMLRKGKNIPSEGGNILVSQSSIGRGDKLMYPEIGDAKSDNDADRRVLTSEDSVVGKFFSRKNSVANDGEAKNTKIQHFLKVPAKFIKLSFGLAGILKNNAFKISGFILKSVKKSRTKGGDVRALSGGEDSQPVEEKILASSAPAVIAVSKAVERGVSSPKPVDSEVDEQYWIDVLKQDPRSPFPYKRLGEIYAARGDYKEARATFKYALRLDPRDGELVEKLEELRGKRTKRTSDI